MASFCVNAQRGKADSDVSFVQFANQNVKRILGDTVYAAYFLGEAREAGQMPNRLVKEEQEQDPHSTRVPKFSLRSAILFLICSDF